MNKHCAASIQSSNKQASSGLIGNVDHSHKHARKEAPFPSQGSIGLSNCVAARDKKTEGNDLELVPINNRNWLGQRDTTISIEKQCIDRTVRLLIITGSN